MVCCKSTNVIGSFVVDNARSLFYYEHELDCELEICIAVIVDEATGRINYITQKLRANNLILFQYCFRFHIDSTQEFSGQQGSRFLVLSNRPSGRVLQFTDFSKEFRKKGNGLYMKIFNVKLRETNIKSLRFTPCRLFHEPFCFRHAHASTVGSRIQNITSKASPFEISFPKYLYLLLNKTYWTSKSGTYC